VLLIIFSAFGGAAASPAVQDAAKKGKAAAKNAADKTVDAAKDAANKASEAASTGAEKAQAELNKRSTRSTPAQ
jgi:calnexin